MPNDHLISRIPPHSIDAEKAVLGSILLDMRSAHDVFDHLSRDGSDFYLEAHKPIFRAIVDLYDNQKPVDILTLQDLLERRGELATVGGVDYLADLSTCVPTSAHSGMYARLVREKALIRQMILAGMDIVEDGYNEPDDVDAYLDQMENKIFTVAQGRGDRTVFSIQEVVNEAFSSLTQFDPEKGAPGTVLSGFYDLDRLTTGFMPGQLIIIAARPGVGKTSMALNIALNAAMKRQQTVAIFSLEMSNRELGTRMLCTVAHVDSHKMRTARIPDTDWRRLSDAADNLYKGSKMFICDDSSLRALDIKTHSRRIKERHGLDLAIVDYLQLMQGDARSSRREVNRQEEISGISRSLKGMAKELQIPVIALSQLNRDLERRADKRPMLADLRESGAIEQDADIILFISPMEEEADSSGSVKVEINIAKNRSGPVDKFNLRYVRPYTLFQNLAEGDDLEGYIPPE